MKFSVRFGLLDLLAFKNLVPGRKKRIQRASARPITSDPVGDLVKNLHPEELHLIIDEVRQETVSTRTFRLVPDPESGTRSLPYFRAGQYLSFKVAVNGVTVTRPYSISSSPNQALNDGFYEITIRKPENGFLSNHAWENWSKGTNLVTSGPCGFFYYERLRDSDDIVALAGGSGITPFRSMIRDFLEKDSDIKFTLIYGTRTPDDIIFYEELKEFEQKAPGKIKIHVVCSEPDDCWTGPTGFLNAECIRNLIGDISGKSFFICGPQLMYAMLDTQLQEFNLKARRIRREVMGQIADIISHDGFPQEVADKTFRLTVRMGNEIKELPAAARETVLVAMERANLVPPSQCRSGECGFCRSRLIAGDVWVSPENDGRRGADHIYDFFHPCSSYPLSDLEIEIPRPV